MQRLFVGLIASIATVAASTVGWAQERGDVEHRATSIRDRFAAGVVACGREPPFTPTFRVETHPGLIFYDVERQQVVIPTWDDLDGETLVMVERFGEASGVGARTYFDDVFNSLLVPHELGHWLELLHGEHPDWYLSELQANRIALAFWRAETGDDEALLNRLANYWRALEAIPSPVPDGADVHAHFNSSPFNPETYGWYQGYMMQEAWRRRDEATFCELVDQAWPASS